jgi:hypothetical protein
MSRIHAVFAALLLAAMTTLSPGASAAVTSKGQVVISGSSASWQSLALAAYNAGACPTATFKVHPPCAHYTNSDFNLNDTRPTLHGLGGTTNVDVGPVWAVWDSPTTGTRNVWVFLKVDSVVGDRCFFAKPECNITSPSPFPAAGNLISTALWGDGSSDTTPPADVQALFTVTTGPLVNTSATDIRPEDAEFEGCRVNSVAGNGDGTAFGDGLDGLGYSPGAAGGTGNAAGTCAQFGATLGQLVGKPIITGLSGSTSQANVLAFNISGHDPFTNSTVTAGTTLDIGADAIVFIHSKTAGLKDAKAATDAELQDMFSGTDCSGTEIGGTGDTSVILREPESGTMTATEMSVFRRPTKTVPTLGVLGVSQEKGVGAATLAATPCTTGGTRSRGIGTSQEVEEVKNAAGTGTDAVGYTFFSFGNVSSITGSSYGYLTLDGNDPIAITGNTSQELPACTAPCSEADFKGWTTGTKPDLTGDSFPKLRAGEYTAWSLLHLVTTDAANVKDLLTTSYKYVVTSSPDYIPDLATTAVDHSGNTIADPGVKIFHSHYQERNGADKTIGTAPTNGTFTSGGNPEQTATDKGGDAGGCTISTSGITATTDKDFIQTGPAISDCTKDRE